MRRPSKTQAALVHPPRSRLHSHSARPVRTNPAPRWQKRLLDLPVLALLATGLAWIGVHYLVGAGTGEGMPHPAEPWLMRLHGLGGFVALMALGSFLSLHIPRGWRGGRRRSSAIALLAAWAITIGSAWTLYYAAPEDWRAAIGLAHALLGAAMGAILVAHRRLPARNEASSIAE